MSLNVKFARKTAAQVQEDIAFLEGELPIDTPEGEAVRRLHRAALWGLYRLREITGEDILDLEDTERLSALFQRAGGHDDKTDPEPGGG